MKITKIDESAYFPESLIEGLQKLGEFIKYDDRPSEEEAIKRLSDTDIAIVEWTEITREMLQKVKRLKYIVVALTGYEFVDVKAANEIGILVSNVPAYSTPSVAEHAFGMLLTLNRNIFEADKAAREGKRDYFEPFLTTDLYKKTLGIVGLGRIGQWIAKIGLGFGMNVIGASRNPKNIDGIKDVTLDELLSNSDVVMVCVDYNESTTGLLSRDRLQKMKSQSYLVSIAPSGIVDENALAEMITQGKIRGACLDIPEKDSPLEKSANTILTPGVAWYTKDTLGRLAQTMYDNVDGFVKGSPINIIK